MRIYTIIIELENEAFQPMPGDAAAFEVGRILDELSEGINRTGQLPRRKIMDINGNTCGKCYVAAELPSPPPFRKAGK